MRLGRNLPERPLFDEWTVGRVTLCFTSSSEVEDTSDAAAVQRRLKGTLLVVATGTQDDAHQQVQIAWPRHNLRAAEIRTGAPPNECALPDVA